MFSKDLYDQRDQLVSEQVIVTMNGFYARGEVTTISDAGLLTMERGSLYAIEKEHVVIGKTYIDLNSCSSLTVRGGRVSLDRFLRFLSGRPLIIMLPAVPLAAYPSKPGRVFCRQGPGAASLNCRTRSSFPVPCAPRLTIRMPSDKPPRT